MKRFDVRALGWVVTRDTCVEIARRALGRRAGMSPAALREMGRHWRAIHATDRADPPGLFSPGQTSTPRARERDQAILAFVDGLLTLRPDLYSEQALRRRCATGCAHAIVSLALGAILASGASSDIPIIGDAVLVLFAIASWFLVTSAQLWRAYVLIRRVNELRKTAQISESAVTSRHSSIR
jgi:hypothetical protein